VWVGTEGREPGWGLGHTGPLGHTGGRVREENGVDRSRLRGAEKGREGNGGPAGPNQVREIKMARGQFWYRKSFLFLLVYFKIQSNSNSNNFYSKQKPNTLNQFKI
jgi:hypothetical protein